MDPNQHRETRDSTPAPPTGGRDSAAPSRRRVSWWTVLLVLPLLFVLVGSLLLNLILIGAGGSLGGEPRVQEKHFSHEKLAENKVAIMNVEGTILEGRGYVKRQIDQALKDPAVKAVVLRIDSPGGTVSGSDFIYHYLRKLAKEKNIPIVVSMGAIAASGGYYISMAVGATPDTIFAEPTTWTGSIGVMIPHYDASGLLAEWGIKQDSIVSHPLKGMGSFTRTMTEQERKILQALVDESFSEFKGIVREGRLRFQKDPQALDRLATGQVYTAKQAKESGLIDRIGYLEDAVDRAIELAGLGPGDVHVVEYKREFSFVDLFLRSRAQARPFDPAALVDLTVPRAYYLWTWLPPVLTSPGAGGRE